MFGKSHVALLFHDSCVFTLLSVHPMRCASLRSCWGRLSKQPSLEG